MQFLKDGESGEVRLLAEHFGVPVFAGKAVSYTHLDVYKRQALARFGGVTGDLAGWFLQWAELAMLAVLVAGGMLL